MCTAAAACGGDPEHPEEDNGTAATGRPAPAGSSAVAEDPTLYFQRVQARLDSADQKLRTVPNLSRDERSRLRRDVNAVQIARAKQLGVQVTRGIDELASAGRLVQLPQSTEHWVVRELDYSEPYLTPDALAMLTELGERFHARLDSLGLPRFRLDITSVLRTPEKQAELRRRNSNASRTESSHEFGTTLDIAYRRFAPPADEDSTAMRLAPDARVQADSMWIETARDRGAELQAILGRAILEMQREGRILVVMERSQTVYHITVGKRYPKRS